MRFFIFKTSLVISVSIFASNPQMSTENHKGKSHSCHFDAMTQKGFHIWGELDYLYYWSKKAPVSIPLVTKGDPLDPIPGAIGLEGTKVLFGNQSLDCLSQSGFKLSLRHWFEKSQKHGLEVSGMYFPKSYQKNFSKKSDTETALPVLGVPFVNIGAVTMMTSPGSVFPQFDLPLEINSQGSDSYVDGAGGWKIITNLGETALLASNGSEDANTGLIGKITSNSSSQLWNIEMNSLMYYAGQSSWRHSGIFGALYMDLAESLSLNYYAQRVTLSECVCYTAEIHDHFYTHNQFFGLQGGVKGEWCKNRYFFTYLVKLGLGDMRAVSYAKGSFVDGVPYVYNFWGHGNSGIFAQKSNHHKKIRNRFSILPQLSLKTGIKLSDYFRTSIGYDFLLMTRVVRPGKQIDRVINQTQAGAGPGGGSAILVGDKRPLMKNATSTYWAQGLSLGLEARF
jgi:Putative beta barrel porin-7 (BBP7)